MTKMLDEIIVIDIESTCWEDSPPEGQESEIIEIGICSVNIKDQKRLNKKSILIKPEYSTISKFCSDLTTLTSIDLENGVSFKEACKILEKEYFTKKRTWCSWGDYDRRQFERQCKRYNVSYPFGITHFNLKNFFAISQRLENEIGMEDALNILNINLDGKHHRGVDDAWNIANILIKVLK